MIMNKNKQIQPQKTTDDNPNLSPHNFPDSEIVPNNCQTHNKSAQQNNRRWKILRYPTSIKNNYGRSDLKLSNGIWFLNLIPIIGWVIVVIWYAIKTVQLEDELISNEICPIHKINHLSLFWLIGIVTVIIPLVYYTIRANQYYAQLKMYDYKICC